MKGAIEIVVLLVQVVLVVCRMVDAEDAEENGEEAPVPRSDVKLGLVNFGSPFFDPITYGFMDRCRMLGITCYYKREALPDSNMSCVEERGFHAREWMARGVRGIALRPCDDDPAGMSALYDEALARGVYFTTFDSDTANSSRAAYVGTDNDFMGRTMAKLLRQLRPEGGTFASIGAKELRTDGFVDEIMMYNDVADMGHWYPARGPTEDFLERRPGEDSYMPHMERAAQLNVTAMIFFRQTPMRHPNYTHFIDRHRHRGTTFIGTDGADYQLAFLNTRYVDGLVGQLPYEIGADSAQALYTLLTHGKLDSQFISTNILSYNLIPLALPELDVDENLIGTARVLAYVCFGIVALSVFFCILWTLRYRHTLIVRAAQPFFLLMVSIGVFIMTASLIPMTFDDGGGGEIQPIGHTKSIGICMSIPWLAFIGFTVTFSALFSKLWRVNRLFQARNSTKRIKVTEIDVIAPFLIVLSANILVLILWTVNDPLMYKRFENTGTDYWNRVISTYGYCTSKNVFAYLVPLATINFFVIIIACWQAFQARSIQSEFSEAKYIGLAIGGLLQAFLTGIPVVVVVRDQPQAFFLVLTMVIFLLGEVVLLLIFLPKVFLHRQYIGMDEEQQKRMFEQRIREARLAAGGAAAGTPKVVKSTSSPEGATSSVLRGPIQRHHHNTTRAAPSSFVSGSMLVDRYWNTDVAPSSLTGPADHSQQQSADAGRATAPASILSSNTVSSNSQSMAPSSLGEATDQTSGFLNE